jgi:uncharacterized protein YkwD
VPGIVQGRRITGPVPDPSLWREEPAAPATGPDAGAPAADAPADGRWEQETDWSGGFASNHFAEAWSGDDWSVDDPDPDYDQRYEADVEDFGNGLLADRLLDEPYEDDVVDGYGHDGYGETAYDAGLGDARNGYDGYDESGYGGPADGAPGAAPGTAAWPPAPGYGEMPGDGDLPPAVDPRDPLAAIGLDPTGAYDRYAASVAGPRTRRRLIWTSVAAAAAAAIVVPAVIVAKAPPSQVPIAYEVLPGAVPGELAKVKVSGWVDEGPNGEAPRVRVEVDGRSVTLATADGESRQRWEWRGPRDERGFGFTVDVGPGKHKVCVIHADADRAPQCTDVEVPGDPGPGAGPTPPTTAPGSTPAAPTPSDPAPETTTSSTTAPTVPPPDPAPSTTAPPVTRPAPTPVPVPPTMEAQMLGLVNAERAKAGLNPMSLCAPLSRAAQSYAQTMSNQKWFDHTGPDGSTLTSRTRAAGYSGSSLAENIARGHTSVTAVMQGWMASAGHRANIMNPKLTHLGVGWAAGNYWVQDFGSGGAC